MLDGLATGTEAEEFEFVVKATVAGLLGDEAFEGLDGAANIERLDAAAAGADEIILMAAGKGHDVTGGALMEAEAAEQSLLLQFGEQAIDGGGIGPALQPTGGGDVGEGEGASGFGEDVDDIPQGSGATQAALPRPLQQGLDGVFVAAILVGLTAGLDGVGGGHDAEYLTQVPDGSKCAA